MHIIPQKIKEKLRSLEPRFAWYMSMGRAYRFLVAVLSLFLVFMTFFDEDNFIRRIALWHEIRQLEHEVRSYETQIEKYRLQLENLQSDKETLERYAREEYLMKRENEDIFVIE